MVKRSTRRARTVSISRRDGALVVSVPARMSRREVDEWVTRMIDDLDRKERRRSARGLGDEELMQRAARLNSRYFDGRATPVQVSWSHQQNHRWGSCTVADATIRLTHRLQTMPTWVVDAVLVHELAHLLEPGHGPRFRELIERYPHTIKAEGFLEGVSFQQGRAQA